MIVSVENDQFVTVEDMTRPELYTKDGWIIDYTMLRVRARAV